MPNDVYQLVMRGVCAGQFWETVQHYASGVTSATDPVTTASNLIQGFIGSVQDAVADALATDNSITGFSSKRVNNGGSPTVAFPQTPVVGTVAGTSATSAVAYCITSEFSNLGKFKSGRWFIPGIPETNLVGNGFTGGAITQIGSIITANATFTQGGDIFKFVVWSRTYSTPFLPSYVHLATKPGIIKRRLLPVM